MIRHGRLLVALALLSSAGIAAAAARFGEAVFNGADPDAHIYNGVMYVYSTGGAVIPVWSSSDFRRFTRQGDLLSRDAIPWIARDGGTDHGLWAPSMLAANGRYYLYYSVGPQSHGRPSRIGVAVCTTPVGPCRDRGSPLLTGDATWEAIDPMAYVDPASGKRYLYAGGSAGADGGRLRVYELGADYLHIVKRVAVPEPPHFTEGAMMTDRPAADGSRRYYLSYSNGRWNTSNYNVQYVTSGSPLGPWIYRGPILTSDPTYKGPGHHSFVQDPGTGDWIIVYHRWENQRHGTSLTGERRVAMSPVHFNADGTLMPIDMRAKTR